MSNEFGFRSYATLRKPVKLIWTDAAMQYIGYAAMASVFVMVLAECGYALYHLSLMVW
ncbi:hypothetical protein QWJ07_03910 [Frankia sp. RB7]|nr:hypothetical protein [Frankia sp. RB7]